MVRTVISLDDDDKSWLDQIAKREHTSMTEVVRRAIRAYRQHASTIQQPSLDALLKRTSGTWVSEDGSLYQSKLRSEWESD
jgi:predicted transcriptional regulator